MLTSSAAAGYLAAAIFHSLHMPRGDASTFCEVQPVLGVRARIC
jgi:hypothetical protein